MIWTIYNGRMYVLPDTYVCIYNLVESEIISGTGNQYKRITHFLKGFVDWHQKRHIASEKLVQTGIIGIMYVPWGSPGERNIPLSRSVSEQRSGCGHFVKVDGEYFRAKDLRYKTFASSELSKETGKQAFWFQCRIVPLPPEVDHSPYQRAYIS